MHRISEHGLIRKIILLGFFQNYFFQSPRTRSFSNFDIVVILMLNYLNTEQWFRLVLFFVLFWFFGGFGSKQCNEMFVSYFSTHRVTNIDLACLFSVLRTAPVIIHHTKQKKIKQNQTTKLRRPLKYRLWYWQVLLFRNTYPVKETFLNSKDLSKKLFSDFGKWYKSHGLQNVIFRMLFHIFPALV